MRTSVATCDVKVAFCSRSDTDSGAGTSGHGGGGTCPPHFSKWLGTGGGGTVKERLITIIYCDMPIINAKKSRMKKPFIFDLIILSKISFHRTRTRTHLVIEPDRTEPINMGSFPISNLEVFLHCVA